MTYWVVSEGGKQALEVSRRQAARLLPAWRGGQPRRYPFAMAAAFALPGGSALVIVQVKGWPHDAR